MYKDPDKQREANAERQRRYKAGQKALSIQDKALPEQGVTSEKALLSEGVTDKALPHKLNLMADVINEQVLGKPERMPQGNIRVSKPGDADYEPQCETTRAFIEGRDKRPEVIKRGKDIKVFADLPPDVQRTINKLSVVDGKIDKTVKANRTAIAINYQHIFPDRFNSVGVAG